MEFKVKWRMWKTHSNFIRMTAAKQIIKVMSHLQTFAGKLVLLKTKKNHFHSLTNDIQAGFLMALQFF